ncbi:MAG: hypothetical protein RL757_1879 [Bacteroidota bacterium]|jgi:outer membrane protein OmpA-like peptidoglycan-associated protein
MNKNLIFLIFIAFTYTSAWGQTSKLREKAAELSDNRQFSLAFDLWQQYVAQKPTDADAQMQLAIAAFHINKLSVAQSQIAQLIENAKGTTQKLPPPVYLYEGRIAQHQLDFKNAIKAYKNFLRNAKSDHPERRAVIADLQRCATAQKIVLQPDIALVENLGEGLNSKGDDFAPLQSPNYDDKIYFSSARENSEGGLRNENGLPDEKNGKQTADIFSAEIDGADWTTPQPLNSELLKTPRHEILLDFALEGKVMLFFKGMTRFSGDILVDTFKNEGETRSLLSNFDAPVRASEGDNSMFLFNDTTLIFASRRAGGFGGLDLYITQKSKENKWSEPKNLGANINSPFDETTPFLAKNGRTLYFSSNNLRTLGGFDVFSSNFDEKMLAWQIAQNLGKSINSAGDETHFRLTRDGAKAYFASSRKDGLGERDIYLAIFSKLRGAEQTPSMPTLFSDVEMFKAATELAKQEEIKISEYNFSPIYYEGDDDILRGANLQEVKKMVEMMKKFPNTKLILTANCAEGDRLHLDIYLTMKKLEKLGKYLVENGVKRENLLLKSVGSSFPIARVELEGQPNLAGIRINQRIDIAIFNADPLLKTTTEEAVVSEFMVDNTGKNIKKHQKGLSYKIQVTATKRMFEGESLTKYGAAMAETVVPIEGANTYQYSVGLLTSFAEAEKMRKQLVADGVKDAWIVPYADGFRINSTEEAKILVKKYADLQNFIAVKRQP